MSSGPQLPTADDRELKLIDLVKDACDTAAAQYEDLYKSFVGLDSKAQAAGTVAGVVTGAVVAVVNATRLAEFLSVGNSVWRHFLLLAPALGALSTVIVSLLAMRVRSTAAPFAAEAQMAEVTNLAKLPPAEFSNGRVLRYYQGRLSYCQKALKDMHAHVQSKGIWVLVAQCLLVATLAALLALFFAIVNTTPLAAITVPQPSGTPH